MAIPMGELITPSSVSAGGSASASVSATGKVTFTNTGNTTDELKVNGCFTGDYDNYLVVITSSDTASGSGYVMRLRAAGSDATAANYTWQSLSANDTTVSGLRSTATSLWNTSLTGGSGNYHGWHVYLYGPALAQPTAMRSVTANDGNSGARIWDYAGTHSLSTAYDGFALYPATGTASGALTVYGLSQ